MLHPAHTTKHLNSIPYSFQSNVFNLAQLSDGVSNGTALWLGGQCIALYLADNHTKYKADRVIELGSGVGLTALALSSLGWDVLATDIHHVISTVLQKNVLNNLHALPPGSGSIQIRQLDWSVSPDNWVWNHHDSIAAHTLAPTLIDEGHSRVPTFQPPFDLIVSADTVYSAELVEPLLRAFHALSTLSITASSRAPIILLCIERRDPMLVDRLLADAKHLWNFTIERIPHKKLAKAVQKGAPEWEKADWEGVEVWKLRLDLK